MADFNIIYTVGELIEVLKEYPEDTRISPNLEITLFVSPERDLFIGITEGRDNIS